jgi:hypothetical protein
MSVPSNVDDIGKGIEDQRHTITNIWNSKVSVFPKFYIELKTT